MARRNGKIIKYRKPININIGVVVFAFLLLYLIFIGVSYMKREHVQMYQVTQGRLSDHSRYTGIILRDELVSNTEYSGYVNYYLREGSKAGVGSLIYSVDEKGTASSRLVNDDAELSPENLAALRTRLSQFSADYDPMRFSVIYDVKYNLQSSLLEYVNQSTLEELKRSAENLGSYFQLIYAKKSGVVVYGTDGFEEKTYTDIRATDFDKGNYKRTFTPAGQLVEAGKPIYKTITGNEWSIIIPVKESDAVRLSEKKQVNVRFPDSGVETQAAITTFVGADQKPYGRLVIDDYMVQYYDSRFIDIEILSDTPAGLKIPASSIVHKDFYIIPTSFLTTGGNSQDQGFLRETFVNGESSVVFEAPQIAYQNEDYCYVDKSVYSVGDNLIKPDSTEQYKIGSSQSLTGAYNVSRGYAVFRLAQVVARGEEYVIVAEGTPGGLSVNDFIALDGLSLSENEIIR